MRGKEVYKMKDQTQAVWAAAARAAVIALMAAVLMMAFIQPAEAAVSNKTLRIRQTYNVIGEAPKDLDQKGTYVLTARGNAPMPQGAGVGSLTFQMTGDQEKVFHLYTGSFSGNASSIVYPCAGVYEYRVAFSSKAKSRRYALDTTRYLIRIYVKNMPDGSLQVERVACIDENHQKADEAVYHHTYQGKAPRPNPSILPKTGDTAMMVLWAAAFCVSLLLLILSLLRRRADRKV
jgi:hypothetical protein